MSRNIEMRVYLNIDEYSKVKEAADTRKITFKTDSELLRKILYDYSDKIAGLVDANVIIEMKIGEYKQQLAQQKTMIENLHAALRDKSNEIDIIKHNKSIKKKGGKK